MDFESKPLDSENLSQKDIMQFLLHSTQHVATREELQTVKQELKADNASLKAELKTEIKDVRSEIKDVRSEIKDVRSEIKEVNTKIDKFLWIMVTGMLGLFFKEYIFTLLGS